MKVASQIVGPDIEILPKLTTYPVDKNLLVPFRVFGWSRHLSVFDGQNNVDGVLD